MRAVEFVHQFKVFSREGRGAAASKSEVRRWVQAGAVQVNGERLEPDEPMDFPLISVVLFPGGRRVSLL
jgi:hypothetical protein